MLRRTAGRAIATMSLLFVTSRTVAAPDEMKFDFASDPPRAGFRAVRPSAVYSTAAGFGFEPPPARSSTITVSGGGCITSPEPFYFSAAVPEGNYLLTVELGDTNGTSDTTVKAELRRLMLLGVQTPQGKTATCSFVVNVRTPQYPGGQVHLKTREAVAEAWDWDQKLTLEFNGKRPCLRTLQIKRVDVPTVFILGDSTVCDQPAEPYASWGQMLPLFFKPDIAVSNQAESGETIASSTSAHRLDKVLSLMKPRDYLMIQYGHNDMKSKAPDAADIYERTLTDWCEKVKHKGGVPILITSMNRYSFSGNRITNSLGEYPEKVRDAAGKEQVPLIDLNAMSRTLYEAMGPVNSVQLFEHAPDSSKFDHTHHSPFGAYELARCVIEGIRNDHLDLSKHILENIGPFDPSKPDHFDQINIPASPLVTNVRPLGD